MNLNKNRKSNDIYAKYKAQYSKIRHIYWVIQQWMTICTISI